MTQETFAFRLTGQAEDGSRGYFRPSLDWREKFVGAVKAELERFLAAVIACTGCRPSEACGGVLICRSNGLSGAFEFYIIGSKTSRATSGGQPLRKLVIDLSGSPMMSEIIGEWVDAHGLCVVTPSVNVKKFGALMSRVGKRCGFKGVTAYSMRHQMAADLKRLGLESKSVSAFMGHVSGKSKGYYGRATQARIVSGSVVLSIECSREVKDRPNEWLDRIMAVQFDVVKSEVAAESTFESDYYSPDMD